MTFHTPSIWFLLLLVSIPFLWWRWRRPIMRTGILFSSTADANMLPSTIRIRLAFLPAVLRVIALAAVIICLARPQKLFEHTQVDAKGVAIEMVIDRSSSMLAQDFTIDGRPVDRLTAVRKVAGDFVTGMGESEGRAGDLIGLVTFAGFADSNCPMTFDHDFLVRDVLGSVQIVNDRSEDGTAIGDALAMAVERLASLDRRVEAESGDHIQSKVIILLTDGENNTGEIDPLTAADMAAAMDITVYTIGAGTKGWANVPQTDVFGRRRMIKQPVNIDEETLQAIADATSGAYFRATDTESLEAIYAAINDMERSEITERTYVNKVDMAVESASIAGVRLPPILLIAFLALLSEVVLRTTILRTTD
ncbi:MAG: VWA domain-containing protein [Phycisphaerales bacterium]|jgi:Ca-activated chloride channel family protein|nr:VWA domain-containing protein [Phycisphaerales bacterium]